MENKRMRTTECNPLRGDAAERNSAHAFRLRGEYIFQSVPYRRSISRGPQVFRWLASGILGVFFLGFIGFQIWRTVSPPQLTLSTPSEGQITAVSQVIVNGHTDPEVMVEINGEQVFSQADGTFVQPIELQSGENKIFVRATKRHGLFTTLSRTIMLKSPEGPSAPISYSPTALVPSRPLN